jgi:hypothetical protein
MLRFAPFLAMLAWVNIGLGQPMASGEYWLDTDPGFGEATSFDFLNQAEVPNTAFNLPLSGLSVGVHVVGFRTRTSNGIWSHTNCSPINIVAQPSTEPIELTEYFLNNDPGYGAGTDANADGTPNVQDAMYTASLASLVPGVNILFSRSRDAQGRWSHTNARPFNVFALPALPEIARTEYFLNTDPGFGAAMDAGVGGAGDVMNADLLADAPGATIGINSLFIRSVDANGKWSHTNNIPVLIEDSTSGLIVRMEYFWDEDPGVGLGMPYDASTSSADLVGEVDQVAVPASFDNNSYHRLFMRALDSRGRWSQTNYRSGIDSIWVDITSDVDQLHSAANISVYPNPFAEQIKVQPTDDQPVRVILYDPQGKLVVDRIIRSETMLDLSKEASGMYTAFFWKDLKVIHRVTLVKQ